MKRPSSAADARGLTLLELLLTLVIFSFVIAIFSQALFQISLFSQVASRAGDRWQQAWSTGFALDGYFGSLRFPDVAQDPRMEGTGSELTVWWVAQSTDREGRPVRARLVLRPVVAEGAGRGAEPVPWALFVSEDAGAETLRARWPHPVSFRYLDSTGQSSALWPQPSPTLLGVRLETLPLAVSVVDARGALAHVWTFGGLTQPGLAARREPFMPGVTRLPQ